MSSKNKMEQDNIFMSKYLYSLEVTMSVFMWQIFQYFWISYINIFMLQIEKSWLLKKNLSIEQAENLAQYEFRKIAKFKSCYLL